jgi:hypothetical protein
VNTEPATPTAAPQAAPKPPAAEPTIGANVSSGESAHRQKTPDGYEVIEIY